MTCSAKSSLAPFSHWERSFSASLALLSLHCLVALNTSLVYLEALNSDSVHWSSNMTALQKALTHENLSSALQITFHFMKKKHLSLLELYLKLNLAPFSLRKKFSASLALHSLHLLSCTKHSISVLALTALFLALKKSSKHENLSSALQITFHFMKETSFIYLSVTLKIAFSNFLSLRKKLSASVALHSLHFLSLH